MSTKSFYIERGQDKFYAWESLESPVGKYGEGATEIQAIGSLCKRLAGEEKWNARIPNMARYVSSPLSAEEISSDQLNRSAPDLLAVVKNLVACMDAEPDAFHPAFQDAARAALAKAE